MLTVDRPGEGDMLVNLQEKLYPDHQAKEGQRALIMMHTVPFEGSVGLVNMLTATRIARKGFKTTLALYGPGVLMAAAGRGFPSVGQEGFPGNLAVNRQIQILMKEGSTVHACRFAMAALYGMRETDLIEGVKPYHPLDVLDCLIDHWRDGALTITTWTV
jgi:uncharacterized repeat protein (TIGR04044 family)